MVEQAERARRDLELGPEVEQVPAQTLISAVRSATSRARWSTSNRISSARPARKAAGSVEPSRNAARATASASI